MNSKSSRLHRSPSIPVQVHAADIAAGNNHSLALRSHVLVSPLLPRRGMPCAQPIRRLRPAQTHEPPMAPPIVARPANRLQGRVAATAVSCALALACFFPAGARAEEAALVTARIELLEARIQAQRDHAELWWNGWMAFYTIGAGVQIARATSATTPAERADQWIGFIKAAGALTRFTLDPYGGIRGLDTAAGGSPESQSARLARDERILEHNANRTQAFGPWYAHLANFAINGTGTIIVGAGFDDWKQGLISGAVGFGVGEVVLLTSPWEADDDLSDYRKGKWQIHATAGGVGIAGTF